jgi:hypothetical protein
MTSSEQPLSGIRVLELGALVAAPYAVVLVLLVVLLFFHAWWDRRYDRVGSKVGSRSPA